MSKIQPPEISLAETLETVLYKPSAQELTDEWQPYMGDYLKQPYALKLNDGREVDWAWPNAGYFWADNGNVQIEPVQITHVKRALDWHFYGNTTPPKA